MELFYTKNIEDDLCFLDEEESWHCAKVLRHRSGDDIDVIDGLGTLLHGTIIDDDPKSVRIQINGRTSDWGGHPYRLDMAVCPPKNAERYDWFVEKACEIGVDTIIPVIGDHSERRVLKVERLRKLAISASKQSLKAHVPEILEPMTVKEFIRSTTEANPEPATVNSVAQESNVLKLFAFCFEVEGHTKLAIRDALASISKGNREAVSGEGKMGNGEINNEPQASKHGAETTAKPHVIIMIGPEGDFSPEEAQLAMAHGFIPIHLGPSRLRTETAALLSTLSVYTEFI